MDKLKQKEKIIKIAIVALFSTALILLVALIITYINAKIEISDRNYYESSIDDSMNITSVPTEVAQEIQDLVSEIDVSKLEKAGWIPTWASGAGLNTLVANPGYFNTISPVWYEVNNDGSLRLRYPTNRASVVSHAKINSIQMMPTIGMFDHNLLGGILRSDDNLNRHVSSIVSTVNTNNYNGIDLDYESISLADRERYFLFLQRLSSELKKSNKKLTVTVLAKWGDNVRYSYRPETREVQDWSRISEYADEVRIMAYDYTYSGDMYPGPIGPTGWIKQILEYGQGKIPANKTVLGIHLYAYEWYQDAQSGENMEIKTDSSQNINRNPNTARAYTFNTVTKILAENTGEASTFEGENIFFYSKQNSQTGILENRALVYIDGDGVRQRMELASKYNLKGVVFWRLGDEGMIFNP